MQLLVNLSVGDSFLNNFSLEKTKFNSVELMPSYVDIVIWLNLKTTCFISHKIALKVCK